MYTEGMVDALALITDVARATGEGHALRAMARAVSGALERHLDGASMELGWVETSRGLDPLVSAALREGRPREGKRRGGGRAVAIPLAAGDRQGYALLGWTGRDLSSGTIEALSATLGAALAQCRLVERVAELSRQAHVEAAGLRRRLGALESPGGELVAQSAAMRAVLEKADLVAPHDTPVLVLGESGTGKELLARRIHARSRRSGGPFVELNCAALPEGLIESELFGHERGAFTGAATRHVGRFERAHGGTLLLDEIGELPLAAQATLLRVLQEGALERVGGERRVRVDVRVIAATHRPLAAMVKKRRFRGDLFYRLNVFPLEVPPLRDRPEDLPELTTRLVAELAAKLGRPAPKVPPRTLSRLLAHDWPGNVRELRNTIERALILGPGAELDLGDWGPPLPGEGRGGLAGTLRATIEQALRASHGRIYGPGGAAERLGLPPSTLQSKLRSLGIDRRGFGVERT